MRAVIWTEGIADQKFLADVIEHWFGFKFDRSQSKEGETVFEFRNDGGDMLIIQSLGGKDTLLSREKSKMDLSALFGFNALQGIQNIVLLDTDDDLEVRKREIDEARNKLGVDFPCFLLPDDKSVGDLETLLEEIITPQNKSIFECWKAYEDCLSKKENLQKPDRRYTLPARKTKIYAYLEALLGESKKQKELIKEAKRDYNNADHWILDGSKEPLKPLKDFLELHLNIAPLEIV